MLLAKDLDLGHARVALEDREDAAARDRNFARLRKLCPAFRAGEPLWALSVHQPWASAIAEGRKRIELRSWRTLHRGPLLICASKRPRVQGLPHGVTVALVEVLDSRPFEPVDEDGALCSWRAGLFGWHFRLMTALDPMRITGRQGLFHLHP